MARRWSIVAAVALAAVAVACRSTPRTPDPAIATLARADAALLQGCYDCLLEARDAYASVATGQRRAGILPRLFEAELLITLREKELALAAWNASLGRVATLASELAPSVEGRHYLAIVDAIPLDDVGIGRADDQSFRRAHQPPIGRIESDLTWLRDPLPSLLRRPVREYLAIALDCMYANRARADRTRTNPAATPVAADAPPLIVYRMGICGDVKAQAMEQVRTGVPRFVEAAYFQARVEMRQVQRTGAPNARQQLTDAYARFAASSSVTYLFGNYNQVVGDCRQALKYYEETLALQARHENALLGRTVCLSYLKRTDEAIAAATNIIDLRLDILADGYYWRAWNEEFMRKDYPAARRDVELAKQLRAATDVFTLAGIIEYDQEDLDPSEKDLKAALSMSGGSRQCTAEWYLGLVGMKKTTWIPAGAAFERAMNCYEQDAADAEEGLQTMERRTDIDPDFKGRQIENFKAALAESRTQQYAGAFNAANYYATGGDLVKARLLVDVAAKDPALTEKVAKLRDFLKDK